MNDPREAWERYQTAQSVAEREYEEFWKQKFASVGIHFQVKDHLHLITVGKYEIEFYVYPRQFEGAKFRLQEKGQYDWRNIKIISESGFKKFLRLLDRLSK